MEDNYSQLVKRAEYIQTVADEVVTRFHYLTTFETAQIWKEDTYALIRLLQDFQTELTNYCSDQEAALEQARKSRASQSFLKRLTLSEDEKRINESQKNIRDGIESTEKSITDLNDLLDRVPVNKTDQKQLLNNLRQIKKELTVEKRTVNENMRQIRTVARQKTASVTGLRGKGLLGTYGKVTRISATSQKENALSPYEQEKAEIELQLIEVDKRINWTSGFTGEEIQELLPAYRCAYCGRRVEPNQPCYGCGSDQVILDRF